MKRALLIIAGLLLLTIAAGLIARFAGAGGVPARTILEVNLETAYPESIPDDPFAAVLGSRRITLHDLVHTLDRAAEDEAIVGLAARIDAAPLGTARIQEVRDAIGRFRAKKKFAVAFSETFGEMTNGNGAYYLASGFDEIWLQPSGDVWLTGLVLELPFIRGTFDKLGIKPSFGQRYEYKNAMNFYTDTKFTAAHREATERLRDSIFSQMVKGIAAGRRLSAAEVCALVDRGPYLGQEAVDAKLVDRLGYRDEVLEAVRSRGGTGSQLMALSKYRKQMGKPKRKAKHTLALIFGVGDVTRGRNGYNPILESQTMGSESVGAAFRAAAEDSEVRAIVFRVDSPGGSYVASDTIWREAARAKKRGKPVIVSMGDVAGSGGYFIAMNADKIVAQPGTITGSIGVLGGKFVLSGFFDKLGLSFDEVHAGQNALFWDSNRDFSPSEWDRFEAWLDRVYEDFTSKVAQGRNLTKRRVLEIARGRVWAGEDAKTLGLVDELGGFETAVRLAKKAAQIPEDEPVVLQTFPKPKTFFESILSRFGRRQEEETGSDAGRELLLRTVRALRPLAQALNALGLGGDRGVLSMPPLEARP